MSSRAKKRSGYVVSLGFVALLALAVSLAFPGTRAAAQSSTTVPPLRHVVFVVGENAGYSQTYGSMPYLDSLAAKYGLATNYVADTHPSIGNYFGLSAGQILSNNDSLTPSSQTFSVDNIFLDVQNAGETWKDYVEEDPNTSGCGALNSGSYYYRHDPAEYYSNINSSNIVCFSQFATDLKNKALPNLSWLVPDGYDDGHDSSPSAFDSWLQTEIAPLLSSSYFQPGGDGLLVVTFDEDENTGNSSCSTSQIESGTWCGGQVETVVISPAIVSAGYQSSNGYHEESILRLMEEALGLSNFPGASANPSGALSPPIDMADFFAQGTTSGSGTVSLSPTSLTFGGQAVGTTSAVQVVTLDNSTSSAISISGVSISGANAGDFAETNTCGTSLSANSTCAISVTYLPSTTASESATLTVNDSAGSQTASLSGTSLSSSGGGGTGPAVSLSPASLTFPSQAVGTTSATQYVTLANTGNAPLTISSAFGISGDFAFAGTGTCPAVGASVAAGGSCLISVHFTPTANGTRTGTITLADNASNSPQTIPLSGTGGTSTSGGGGTTAPAASLSPASLTFASQTIGATSAAQAVTLSNTGNASLSLSGIALGGADSGDFAETNNCGTSVAAGANCTINVTFTPAAAGTLTASLAVTDNASGSPQSVSLSGTGASSSSTGGGSTGPAASLLPASLTFPSQAVGTTSATQYVTLLNTGNAPLTISSAFGITGDFAFAGTGTCPAVGASVAAGGSCLISVHFTPTANGTRTGTITLADNASNSPQTIPLSGTGGTSTSGGGGTTAPAASLSPASLTFASQTIGATSAAQAVTLSNTGNASLSLSGIALGGADSGDFAETNNCGTSVAAGANCTIDVTFTPAAAGTLTASLAVTDNASGSPQSVGLSGTGASSSSTGGGSTGPVASLLPASLTFPSQAVGTTSATQYVTLANTGNAPLTISSAFGITGDFAFAGTGTCPAVGASIAAGGSCLISVHFTPTAAGTRTGTITLADNASSSPQSISLTGTGSSTTSGGGTGGSTGGGSTGIGSTSNGATNYYVSTAGSDSGGNGTISSPWATIGYASTQIGPGAVVHVAAGTYTGPFTTSASGTSSAPILYEADTANFSASVNCAQVTASHGSLSSCVQLVGTSGTVWYNSGDYVTIQGFDVSGPNIGTDLDALGTSGNHTQYLGNSVHDIETSGCSSGGDGAIGPNGANGVVDGNYLYNIGAPGCNYTQGIYPNGSSTGTTLIENNIIMGVSSSGIQSWGNSGGDIIVNNTIVNVGTTCIVIGSDTSGQTNGNDFVANNICYATPLGIQEQGYSASATGANNVYENNLFFNDTTTYLLQNGLVGTGTVSGNPLFVNYTGTPAGDYHLQSSSPAIGAATSTNAPTADFDGNARPSSGQWDIGAYN